MPAYVIEPADLSQLTAVVGPGLDTMVDPRRMTNIHRPSKAEAHKVAPGRWGNATHGMTDRPMSPGATRLGSSGHLLGTS
jgi:hypothetical protein